MTSTEIQLVTIDILMCTYKRPQVTIALGTLAELELPKGFILRVIVADNDEIPSAYENVTEFATKSSFPILYIHAPANNISIARNACLEQSEADYVAFIDDDEIAPKDWLVNLWSDLQRDNSDGVFGPAIALYGDDTASWFVDLDVHSNIPKSRSGVVETGHTCNALIRWKGTNWYSERFDIAKGTSGGEDTFFFYNIHKLGAKFSISRNAKVYEKVEAHRLNLSWVKTRFFRSGQTYAFCVITKRNKPFKALTSLGKVLYCHLMCIISFGVSRKSWLLRRTFHLGFLNACFCLLYTSDAADE